MADRWIKSSRCVSDNHCVEVAFSSSVKVRDRAGRVIEVDPRAWQLFIDAHLGMYSQTTIVDNRSSTKEQAAVKAKDIKKGFTNRWWTAIGDAYWIQQASSVEVMVQWKTDQGKSPRQFAPDADVPGHYPEGNDAQ